MLKPQELVFGRFLEQTRKSQRIPQAQLAQKLGYKNINKGVRRVADIESGNIDETLINSIMQILAVSQEERQRCALAEQLNNKRLIKSLPPFEAKLFWRTVGCLYAVEPVPEYLQTKTAQINFARQFAKERHRHCRLELDYDLRYWISPDGNISMPDRRLVSDTSCKPYSERVCECVIS